MIGFIYAVWKFFDGLIFGDGSPAGTTTLREKIMSVAVGAAIVAVGYAIDHAGDLGLGPATTIVTGLLGTLLTFLAKHKTDSTKD